MAPGKFATPDGALIAAGNQDGDLFVWDARAGEVIHSTKQPGFFFRLAFSPDGRRLAGVDREKVQMWNARDGQEVLLVRGAEPRSLDGGFNPALAWSRDSQQLASLNWNGTISVWNASEQPSATSDRWRQAESRVFAWHLAEAEAAAAQEDGPAASVHLRGLREKEPPDVTSLVRRGRLYMLLGDWDEANADYARWLRSGQPDDDGTWVDYARVLLARGDLEGYHRLCARMWDGYEKHPRAALAWIAAYAIGLAPGPSLPAARVVGLAERTLSDQRRLPHHSFALALAHYRAMEWEPASVSLRESMKGDPAGAWRSWPVMAMTEYRMGHLEESRRALEQALQWLDQHQPTSSPTSKGTVIRPEWLDFQAHCREAAALLSPEK